MRSSGYPESRISRDHADRGEGEHVLLASEHAITEARRNLVRKGPGSLERFDATALGALERVPEPPPPLVDRASGEGLPGSDAPILAAAIASGADVLVTGDRRHFGEFFGTIVEGVEILSLAGTLARLLG